MTAPTDTLTNRAASGSAVTIGARTLRRIRRLIVITLFIGYAWFFQGGGWNQNSRFDQVRAVVEGGTWAINDYCVYVADAGADGSLDMKRAKFPGVNDPKPETMVFNTGDFSQSQGRLYPNKPPGATILALPSYVAVRAAQRLVGANPDHWASVTAAAYLITLLSVGAAGAVTGLLFFELSRTLNPGLPLWCHLASTWTVGFGTLLFPFSTMLFDHVPVAAFLLGTYWLVQKAIGQTSATSAAMWLMAAGCAGGFAVACNYAAVLALAMIGVELVVRLRPRLPIAALLVGAAAPAAFLMIYHAQCFGAPFTIATERQSSLFSSGEQYVLGVFSWPDPKVAIGLLIAPARGLWPNSPATLLAIPAMVLMLRSPASRPHAVVCLGVFALYLLMNASFNAWHGGYSYGPRYLIPAIPFLMLPVARAFHWLPLQSLVVACVSIALCTFATAVDAQVPVRFTNPFVQYLLPMAFNAGNDAVAQGNIGPVSVNSQGIYEPKALNIFPFGSEQAKWNSFNLGEFLFPQSWLSVLPMLALCGAGAWLSFRLAKRLTPGEPTV